MTTPSSAAALLSAHPLHVHQMNPYRLLSVTCLFIQMGCGKEQPTIEGTWSTKEGDISIEFLNNEKMNAVIFEKYLSGSYSLEKEGVVTCDWDDGTTESFEFENSELYINGSYPSVLTKTKSGEPIE